MVKAEEIKNGTDLLSRQPESLFERSGMGRTLKL